VAAGEVEVAGALGFTSCDFVSLVVNAKMSTTKATKNHKGELISGCSGALKIPALFPFSESRRCLFHRSESLSPQQVLAITHGCDRLPGHPQFCVFSRRLRGGKLEMRETR